VVCSAVEKISEKITRLVR